MNFSYYEHYISLCLHEIKLIKTVITIMLLKPLLHVSARAGRHQVQIYKTKFCCAASMNRPRSMFLQFCCKKGLIKYYKIEFTTEPWWRASELVTCVMCRVTPFSFLSMWRSSRFTTRGWQVKSPLCCVEVFSRWWLSRHYPSFHTTDKVLLSDHER